MCFFKSIYHRLHSLANALGSITQLKMDGFGSNLDHWEALMEEKIDLQSSSYSSYLQNFRSIDLNHTQTDHYLFESSKETADV